MKPTTYTITLTVRTDAPLAVLRDWRSYLREVKDQKRSPDGEIYDMDILKVVVKEREPSNAEAQHEFGGCS